jgi:hypothetical protein
VELLDLVPSLQRAVAPPGEFVTYFPLATDDDLVAAVADAIAEAQLDGFLSTASLNLNAGTVTPDLNGPQQALVILYGMARVIRARIANAKNRTRYKAGPVEAEEEQSASVLVQMLRDIDTRKKELLEDAKAGNIARAFVMVDMYVAKAIDAPYASDLGYSASIERF